MKTVYFVRHGETEGNSRHIYQTSDTPLSGRGKEQARQIASRISTLPIEIIISSPMSRALNTAQAIADVTGKEIVQAEYLKERLGPKEQRGVSMDDPKVKAIVQKVSENFHVRGWQYSDEENFDALNERAVTALRELSSRPEQNMVAVTHGLFLRVLLAKVLLGKELTGETCRDILKATRTTNTGLTVMRYGFPADKGYFGSSESGWQLVIWNDHAHLG